MFKFTKRKQTKLDQEIDALLDDMRKVSRIPTMKEHYDEKKNKTYYDKVDPYTPMVDNLEKLYKAKAATDQRKIDPKTAMIVAGNLIGIILILKHEQLNVVTSKALGFVIRGRA